MRPHGVILAGGRAVRLGGGDKPLRALGGTVLLEHVIARVGPQVDGLALSANGDAARFAAFGILVIADATPDQGPLAGMLAGLIWAAGQGAAWLLSVPGDAPFLPRNLVVRLATAQALTGRPIVHAASGGRDHPTVALIATGLAADLERGLAAGLRSVRAWMAPHGPAAVAFGVVPVDPFANLNTVADFAAAEAALLRNSPP